MKRIRIVDDHYRFLCEVDDGKMLEVWKPGKEANSIVEPCHYLDEYHFQYGVRTFHVCQFGEWLKREGYQAKPLGYYLDYKRYPMERFFGHEYHCLDKKRDEAFYYNPKEEYPFVVCLLDEAGRRKGIPDIGVSLMETVGYDVQSARWELDFDMEKIKNVIYFDLPQTVMDTDEEVIKAKRNYFEKRRADLQEAYMHKGMMGTAQEAQLMKEIYQMEESHRELKIEEQTKCEYTGMIRDTHKVFTRKDFQHCDFSGLDLAGYTFIYCEFNECALKPEDVKDAIILGCNMPKVFFQNAADRGKTGKELR
ncbi:MAG: hypothetical protein K2M78_15405 [Lachnospiraceae bacterium]|nr:hypothetical protein [Lachnospiraceae bacterium]